MAKKRRATQVRTQRANRTANKEQTATATGVPSGSADQMLRVRMYRQGLGDCFLVSLPKKDGNRFYIMVDCGIVVGSPNPGIMQDVVKSIIEDTGGYVDVLVVTHEHYDHVSGFTIAQELFADKRTRDKLAVGEVWFAWTEDPNNALGKRLRGEREKRRNKLAAFVDAMQEKAKRDDGMKSLVEGVDSLLGFFGVAKGKLEQGTGPAMKFAAELAKVRYCRPTDKPTGFSDVPNVRLYVLGPPPEEKLLRKTDSKTEVYHLAGLGAAHSFFMTFAEPDEQALLERYQPFEPHNRCSLQELENSITDPAKQSDLERKFFLDHYFGPLPDADSPDQSWRRIDNAYMDAAAEFALQLDSATNNTSLVLAFELIDSGKVLLFAADAQVGNWLSWQDLQWKLDAHTTVTGPDLLRRTVFYKVGHHGSHNATLRAKGLELMQSSDLVAFVPVDHKMAVKKGWGKMPLEKLMTELRERTKGRVVRADQEYEPKTLEGREFLKALTTGPNDNGKLFYEWSMTLS